MHCFCNNGLQKSAKKTWNTDICGLVEDRIYNPPPPLYNKYVRKMTDFEEERIDTYSTDLDEIFTQYS